MRKPVQITMPSPCPVKEEFLTPTDNGWFCKGCKKKVFDFTQYSDEQLARIRKNKEGRCGMFMESQINRPLMVPQKKNFWFTTAAFVISLFTVSVNKGMAQETIQNQSVTHISQAEPVKKQRIVTGNIYHRFGGSVEGAKVKVKGTSKVVYTDKEGNFSIEAKKGDVLKINSKGCKTERIIISDDTVYSVKLLYKDKSLNRRRVPGYF